jgi:hypothetical protein
MPVAESIQPMRHTVDMGVSHPFVALDNRIFSFRTIPVNFGRWTITTWPISFLQLTGDPLTVHAQIHFPQNTDISISDNFSVLVAQATRDQVITSSWRVDSGDNPQNQYQFDFLITMF